MWYGAFEAEKEARDFERYLKSGSGKAFVYKRLISEALVKDFSAGRKSSPKRKWRIPGRGRYWLIKSYTLFFDIEFGKNLFAKQHTLNKKGG